MKYLPKCEGKVIYSFAKAGLITVGSAMLIAVFSFSLMVEALSVPQEQYWMVILSTWTPLMCIANFMSVIGAVKLKAVSYKVISAAFSITPVVLLAIAKVSCTVISPDKDPAPAVD
jgi:hypothetical protein